MVSTSYNDHVSVLNFYKMKIPKSKRETKKAAERILAKKLCNCVSAIVKSKRPLVPLKKTRKRTTKAKEQAAVAICRNSIFRKKGIMNYAYTCKNKQKLIPGKNGDCLMKYTRKTSIKGGKKKRKYTKKGGHDENKTTNTVFKFDTLKSLTPDKNFEWRHNIRGSILSKDEINVLIKNDNRFSKIQSLINNNESNIIVSKDECNYNLYFVDLCDGDQYPTKEHECYPMNIPIIGIVSPDNPFRCRKKCSRKLQNPPSVFSFSNKRKQEDRDGDGNRQETKHQKTNHNSPTTITETNFPTVKKIR